MRRGRAEGGGDLPFPPHGYESFLEKKMKNWVCFGVLGFFCGVFCGVFLLLFFFNKKKNILNFKRARIESVCFGQY